jgi:hypothetical protein
MKNTYALLLALLLTLGLAAMGYAGATNNVVPLAKPAYQNGAPHHGHHLDNMVYSQDWESGTLSGWVGRDLSAQPSTWHLDTWNAFAGTSWWVGDTSATAWGRLNGYLSDWYMALNSPSITLPASNPTLLFWHRYSCELPEGPFPDPQGTWNGWDGLNLRISTDDGTTWTVVPNTAVTPAYDRTSLYSFGFQHHEGANVPGWCGANTTWHLQRANLSQWAGQTVKLRWAFASDPEYDTSSNGGHAMFGWEIDNVRVYDGGGTDTVFTDDCNAVGGWTHVSVRPTGGNLWRVATDNTSPAGPHIVVCNNASNNLYNANMNDVLESPYFRCDTLPFGTLMADVQLTGVVQGAAYPDADYWTMEVSIDSGASWCKVSNPTCDPNGTSYVYTDLPTTWSSFNASYSDAMDFTALIGHVLKFRFVFESNPDNLLAVGPKFDGFTLEHTPGYNNDVSCYTLQVRYPNVANRPIRITAYFRNEGQNAQNDLQGWWRIGSQNWRAFLPTFSLNSGVGTTRDTATTITSAGVYSFGAKVVLSNDDNHANDSTQVIGVQVAAAGSALEIGYDNHVLPDTFFYFPRFATGSGPLMHFTPIADNVLTAPFRLQNVSFQFSDQQPSDNMPIRLHVYRGGAGSPVGEIVNQLITVGLGETGTSVWKTVDLTGDPDTRSMGLDFWVWLETVSTDPTERYPAILGADAKPWADQHNYSWTGTESPTTMDYFFQMHATLLEGGDAADNHGVELPAAWAIDQNYPNPFNPTTEIRFAVPRAEMVTLKIFNLIGQDVATLVNGMQQPGTHTVSFDGANLPSGVYFYRIESASFSATRKMLLMK